MYHNTKVEYEQINPSETDQDKIISLGYGNKYDETGDNSYDNS